ncbi:hypothetical protein KAFR_0H01650 [Kazachstania africana CBS 2517]|uniref:Porphobilinogen deaminase n=1 Tax=Kazachstania africana (strain ATCC 22294 / BCRC 22015 / CBS 2517 / CECT 1963 / NBRC 1671 / NRRL Y-8276) TaxID=1071382 RepID=H2AZ19_KAZAF|nr:hypothetical protein KAFR_0H01650 [Kazachstania africana CBS 2517]CCF59575.1 hypothetical protein KAFR_0H01650 [Kazachstania africana CBS 2517]
MTQEIIRIGSRKSALAITQSEHVKSLIENEFPQYCCEIITRETLGDQIQFKPLYSFGGKALWTKELEDYLYHQDERLKLDIIVHSLKDMPTLLPEGFQLGCVTQRIDPSDCVVMSKENIGRGFTKLEQLPTGSVVGTSSVRRSAQLKKKYSGFKYESVRGNIQTRLSKLDDSESPYDCIILASAGLIRLGFEDRISSKLDSSLMYHAVGQGALGIEIRANDERVLNILHRISDVESTICCLAERQLMRSLEGGCSVPIGVKSSYDRETKILTLKGIVTDMDGVKFVEDVYGKKINVIQEDAIDCGAKLADKMISNGAKEILDEINIARLNEA